MIKGHSGAGPRAAESEAGMLQLVPDDYSSSSSTMDTPPSRSTPLLSVDERPPHNLSYLRRDSPPTMHWGPQPVYGGEYQSYAAVRGDSQVYVAGLSHQQELSDDSPYSTPRGNTDIMLQQFPLMSNTTLVPSSCKNMYRPQLS